MSIVQEEQAAISAGQLLERVREIEPIIRKYAAEAEKERRLSRPVVEAMRDAGLIRMWRPTALGGLEVDPVTGLRVMEAVARIDSAAGWNLCLAGGGEVFAPWFSDRAAQEIFGDDNAIIAGAFNPPRRAVPAEGGYRVTGKTSFNSGAHNATWIVGFAQIFDGKKVRTGADGAPITLMTAVRAGEVEIVDNWNTMGMSGTGSHDVVMNDVFVPEDHTCVWAPLETRTQAYSGPLYRLSIWPAVSSLAAPALGIARSAIDGLIDLAKSKVPAYTEKTLKDHSVLQSRIGQAEAKLGAARAYLHRVFQDAYAEAVGGREISTESKCQIQLAMTHAALASAEAVDLVHAAVGASGIRQEYAFEKHFRDIHVITQHAFVSASRYEAVGQIKMGLEPDWPFFAF